MTERTCETLSDLARDGIGGDLVKAAKFNLAWTILAPSLARELSEQGHTKTAGMLMPALLMAMMGIPIAQAYLQRGQMEAYNRGQTGAMNEMAPWMAATMGPYGGLGIPTTMRNLTGMQGQGMA